MKYNRLKRYIREVNELIAGGYLNGEIDSNGTYTFDTDAKGAKKEAALLDEIKNKVDAQIRTEKWEIRKAQIRKKLKKKRKKKYS